MRELPPGASVLSVQASNSLTTSAVRSASDSHDIDFAARSRDESFYAVRVACENRSFLPKGGCHHNGVNHIRRFGPAQQPPCFVRLGLAQRYYDVPSQEAPEWACCGDRLT